MGRRKIERERVQIRLLPKTKEKLDFLSEKGNVSQSAIIDHLIRKRFYFVQQQVAKNREVLWLARVLELGD